MDLLTMFQFLVQQYGGHAALVIAVGVVVWRQVTFERRADVTNENKRIEMQQQLQAHFTGQITTLQTEVNELQDALRNQEAQYKLYQEEAERTIRNQAEDLKKLESRIEQVMSDLKESRAQVTALKLDLDGARKANMRLSKVNDSLVEKDKQHIIKREHLEKQVQDLTEEIAQLKREIEQLRSELETERNLRIKVATDEIAEAKQEDTAA
jgi:chromosome segregation ATPase